LEVDDPLYDGPVYVPFPIGVADADAERLLLDDVVPGEYAGGTTAVVDEVDDDVLAREEDRVSAEVEAEELVDVGAGALLDAEDDDVVAAAELLEAEEVVALLNVEVVVATAELLDLEDAELVVAGGAIVLSVTVAPHAASDEPVGQHPASVQ